MFDTAAAIFWMYNDSWPMVRSWTIVDYYMRRTPSYHPVRRAFAPLTVALAAEGGMVRVFGINEGAACKGQIRYGLFALAGGYPLDRSADIDLPANSSTLIGEFPESQWRQQGVHTHAAFGLLSRNGAELARDTLFLPFYREIAWPVAEVTVRREPEKVVFSSQAFAWRVCLDLDGDAALPDNFFDLLPGIPYQLEWPTELPTPSILRTGNLAGPREATG